MRLIVLHQGWEPHDHPHMPGSGVAHGIDQMNAVLHHSLAWTHLVVIGASSGAASGISCSAGLPSFEKGAAAEDRPYSPLAVLSRVLGLNQDRLIKEPPECSHRA
jgi:hypothetical protein